MVFPVLKLNPRNQLYILSFFREIHVAEQFMGFSSCWSITAQLLLSGHHEEAVYVGPKELAGARIEYYY